MGILKFTIHLYFVSRPNLETFLDILMQNHESIACELKWNWCPKRRLFLNYLTPYYHCFFLNMQTHSQKQTKPNTRCTRHYTANHSKLRKTTHSDTDTHFHSVSSSLFDTLRVGRYQNLKVEWLRSSTLMASFTSYKLITSSSFSLINFFRYYLLQIAAYDV